MKIKQMILLTLLLSILMIGAVSASENTTNDISSSDVSDNSYNNDIATGKTNIIDTSTNGNEPLTEEYSPTSFKALNQKIKDASAGSTIKLSMDYAYNHSSDTVFKEGVPISKSLKIDGNGKTIYGRNHVGIFHVMDDVHLIINNLKIINSYAESGAIKIDNNCDVNISDSIFTKNTAKNGGAISINRNCKVTITGSQFTQNTAKDGDGGAIICFSGGKSILTIINSQFTQNIAKNGSYGGYGGAIAEYGVQLILINNTFTQNTADLDGGAIYIPDCNMTIISSQFIQNTAKRRGDSISGGRWNVIITKTNFTKNNLYLSSNTFVDIHNCTFIESDVLGKDLDLSDCTIITKPIVSLSINNIPNYAEDSPIYIIATLKINGETIKGETIFFTIDNSKVWLGEKTDEEGIARFTTGKSILALGPHKVKLKYNDVVVESNEFTIIQKQETYTGNNIGKNLYTNSGNNNQRTDSSQPTTAGTTITSQSSKVTKQTIKIIVTKKTFKHKVKVKKYTVTLKQGNKAINKATMTLKVKGKKYTAKTNKRGKATFKITKLNKKGTYKAVISYKGTKKTVKIVIK